MKSLLEIIETYSKKYIVAATDGLLFEFQMKFTLCPVIIRNL